ncbi:ArsR/SmtB family transcription factor [Streptomyces sp. NPDC087300]|uniref:ArsR/SmtB family transcription factor n=1 Tax=Streptomyces sp. NPDC087300 TaxID=3365780 RepID=UPI00380D0DBD
MTSDDLLCIRMASTPDPMWELVLSVQRLRDGAPASRHGIWRQRVRHQAMNRGDLLGRVRRVLMPLLPSSGVVPDFLVPDGDARDGVGVRIAAIAPAPVDGLLGQPGRERVTSRMTRQERPQHKERRPGRDDLRSLLWDYYACAIRPHWEEIRSSVESDRLLRARSFLDGGIHGHLRSYAPFMRWEPPVLHVPGDAGRDLYLDGRGLLLVPSHFCGGRAYLRCGPGRPAVLIHPAAQSTPGAAAANRALARVLGSTRAAILVAAGTATTSGELGRCAGVSAPAVSHHLSALRNCGLLRSFRHGSVVLHVRTPTGSSLVRSAVVETSTPTPAGVH